jgi:hypothetical protein
VSWSYGCERDSWALAQGSVLVEPVELLSREEKVRLIEVLRGLDVEEPVAMCPMGPPLEVRDRAEARAAKAKGRARAKSA